MCIATTDPSVSNICKELELNHLVIDIFDGIRLSELASGYDLVICGVKVAALCHVSCIVCARFQSR